MKDLIKLADGKIQNKDTRKCVHNDVNIRKNRWQKKIPYEKVCQIHGPLYYKNNDNPDNPN